jgi:hypothetical protein
LLALLIGAFADCFQFAGFPFQGKISKSAEFTVAGIVCLEKNQRAIIIRCKTGTGAQIINAGALIQTLCPAILSPFRCMETQPGYFQIGLRIFTPLLRRNRTGDSGYQQVPVDVVFEVGEEIAQHGLVRRQGDVT